MPEPIRFHFDVDGENFTSAGEASVAVKKKLRQLGYSPDIIRKVSIAMYEGEINMVIHANGGKADVDIILTILAAVIVLGFLVFIHEGGHYLAARAFGLA